MNELDKQTILVVDDGKMNRKILSEIFKNDCHVLLADDGPQALEIAKEHLPDVILLDVVMPEMSGHEVIKHLKNDDLTRAIPVLFITGLDTIEDEEKGLNLGAADYVTKLSKPGLVISCGWFTSKNF